MIIKDANKYASVLSLYYDIDILLDLSEISEIDTTTHAIKEYRWNPELVRVEIIPTNYGQLRYREKETGAWIRDIEEWIKKFPQLNRCIKLI